MIKKVVVRQARWLGEWGCVTASPLYFLRKGEIDMTTTATIPVLSNPLQTMLEEARGFRNNEWGESRVWNLQEVVYHEMTVLMNSDIPEFLNEHYRADICLDDNGRFDSDAFECEAPCYVSDVMEFIRSKVGEGELYGIWLTTKSSVLKIYDSGRITPVSMYQIPADALVISDLDIDGTLFVTKTHPDDFFISRENVNKK